MGQNLRDRIQEAAEKYSSHIAVQYKEDSKWVSVSYNTLEAGIKALSGYLQEEEIRKNDKVAIILENRLEWPLIFLATIYLGAISIPINPESSREEIENILKDSGCKLVFTGDKTFAPVNGICQKCSSAAKVISVDSGTFKSEARKPSIKNAAVEIRESDLACILYTSGTTDEPKGVMLSHKNLISNCGSLHKSGIFTYKDSIISILPLHHAYPLTVTMLLPLLYGSKIIYPGSIRPEDLFEALKKNNPTIFIAVPQIFYLFHQKMEEQFKKIPFIFRLLLNRLAEIFYKIRNLTGINFARIIFKGIHKRFGRSMRLFVSGGAKLDENIESRLFKLGFTILEGYGLTETAPVLTMNPIKRPKIGSAGLPIPGVELKIKDKNEKGIGEVIARGLNIMEGYYKREDLTHQAIKDGWFYTGDLGYIDKDGYLFLTGRLKEIIVLSSGLNIYPDEIEKVYSKNVPIKEMCVFETSTGKGLEENLILGAVVVPDLEFFKKHGLTNLYNIIKERFDNVSRTLPSYKRIKSFSITLEDLPRTLLGKVKRFAVKEKYAPKIISEEYELKLQELSEEEKGLMQLETSKKVINCLEEQIKAGKEISLKDLLELDLGIDSLGRIELLSGLERAFNIRIRDDIVGEAFTVKDLVRGIDTLLKEETQTIAELDKKITPGPAYWNDLLKILPKKENLERIDLNPGPGAWIASFIFCGIVYLFFKIFYSLKIEGKENIPKKGPYILYVNHASYFDGFIAAVALANFQRVNLFFVGYRSYFDVPIIRNLVKIGRIIPLDFSSHLIEALRSSFYVLKNGKSVCLFPEGLRTLGGEIGEFKKGFGILAKESGAKLVPVLIEGAYEAWPRTKKFPKRHPVRIKFGKSIEVEEIERKGYNLSNGDSYKAICAAAKKILEDMKESEDKDFKSVK